VVLTPAAVAGRRGASAAFVAAAFALTDRVIGRPTVPGAVEGLDIPTRVVVVVVALVVEPLIDAAEVVRLMVFRVILLPVMDRGAVALVVVVRLGKALGR
jgi:hypothetical protein